MVGITSNKIDKFKVAVKSLITFRWSENWLRIFTVNCYPNRRRCQSQGGHCFFMAHILKTFAIDLRKREIWLRFFNQCRFYLFTAFSFFCFFVFILVWIDWFGLVCVNVYFWVHTFEKKKKKTLRCPYTVRMIFVQRCITTWALGTGTVVLFGFNTPM